MSDAIKHECGISVIRLLKPLEYYKEKYGSAFYGVNKMYLMMEKQHNRGQDGAGFASIKLDVTPGERYMSRVRSCAQQPIQDIFAQINDRINKELKANPAYEDNVALQKNIFPTLANCCWAM
jgi:amidophosphoribosyltransferase